MLWIYLKRILILSVLIEFLFFIVKLLILIVDCWVVFCLFIFFVFFVGFFVFELGVLEGFGDVFFFF